MKNIIILIFLIFSFQCFSQILPSSHGVHHKKQSQSQSDYFDDSSKGNYIVISGNSVTSSYAMPSHKWNSVYGSEGISSGIKEWEITVDSYFNSGVNTWELIMGVAHERTNGNTYFPYSCRGYCYISEFGGKNTTNGICASGSNYGDTYGAGDVIKIQLNMNNGQLVFFKNGTSQGVSHTLDTNKTWYLAISIGNAGTSVSITG